MASLRTKLERLESLREEFGAPAASEKLLLLTELEHKSLGRAAEEQICRRAGRLWN
jgi:hypothetical protein